LIKEDFFNTIILNLNELSHHKSLRAFFPTLLKSLDKSFYFKMITAMINYLDSAIVFCFESVFEIGLEST